MHKTKCHIFLSTSNKTYPAIREEAARLNAIILWQDETAASQSSNFPKFWSQIGTPSKAFVNGKGRYGQTTFSIAFSEKGESYFKDFEKAMTADDFVIFLKGLIRKNPKQKLIMICDNASIHNAAVVKNWLTRHPTLQIRHLPPYAPKHNPVEFANQVLKSRLRYSAATDKKGNCQLAKKCLRELAKNHGHGFKAFFCAETTKYIFE